MRTTVEQALAIAAAMAAGIGLLLTHHPWGLELLLAGTAGQLALGFRLLVLIETRHDVCRDLLVEDRLASGTLLVLECEWHRLADPRCRVRLAKSIDELAAVAARPLPRVPASRPYFNVRVVRTFEEELHEVASLLRGDEAAVRGVALAERLLTFPGSPLWGADRKLLAEELARIRYLLLQPRLEARPGRSERQVLSRAAVTQPD